MSAGPPRQENFSVFEDRYAAPDSEVERRIEREVFGHSSGVNGFATLEQADALAAVLNLGSGSTVLELGAGRGWLASHVAEASGCRLISSDVPTGALLQSNERFSAQSLMGRASTVAADARALPLRPEGVDAVIHSDVFC